MATKPLAIRYPNIHVLMYAESGSGKSTLWATLIRYYATHFNEPSLVFMFDPPDMSTPYRDLGTITQNEDQFYKDLGIKVQDIVDANGHLIVRIEFYCDIDPEQPQGCSQFERRLQGFYKEAESWASVAIDSMTHYQHSGLLRAKRDLDFKLYAPGKDGRQPYGLVAEQLAILLFSRTAHWPTNVGVLCHIDENKEDFGDMGVLKTMALQGKMAKRAPSGFGEVYTLRVLPKRKDDKGNSIRELQTVSDERFVGKHTVTKAPDVIVSPTYESLWANWQPKQ